MPAASLRVLRKVKALRDNSPAVRAPSILRAPHLAVSRGQADPEVQALAQASGHVQASAALRAQVVLAAHGPDSVALPAQLRLQAKRHVRNEPAMPGAAAVVSNIPRRRKAR